MAHNIFHTGFDFIKDKTTDLVDNVKDFGTDLYVDYKVDKMVNSFKDEFKGPPKMTPELAAAGWKPGLDGIPYNPAIAYTAEDWANDQKNANANRAGRASGAVQQSAPAAELSQDLRQRTPSGTMYNPDLSAYNDSSLFDYKGPGGVSEYTYGQGLPTEGAGYDIWGTPTDVANPYYEGQFGEGFVEPGVADTAITLPPITMPAGVPQVPTSNTNARATTTPTRGTNPYQSGMDSNLLNSYINETGIGTATQGSGMGYTGGVNEPGIGTATQGSGMGYSGGANEVGIGSATQGSGMGYSGGANETGAVGIPGYTNNGVTSAADQSIFNNAMQDRLLQQEKETVSNGYVNNGITTPEDQGKFDAAKLSRFNPSGGPNIYASQYSPTTDTGLITIPEEEEQQQLIFSQPMSVNEQARRTNPSIFDDAIMMEIGDIITKDSPIKQQYGLDEATIDALGYINSGDVKAANANFNQMKINQPTTSGYAGNIMINPMTADTSPSEIAFQNAFTASNAGGNNNKQSGMTLPTSSINKNSGDAEGRALYNAIKNEAMNNMASTGYLGIQDTPKPRTTGTRGGRGNVGARRLTGGR